MDIQRYYAPNASFNAKINREVVVAMKQWAQTVVSIASDHAPILTGQLRRSITMSDVKIEFDTMTILVGPDQSVRSYAARQEFDTSLGFGPISQAAGATRPWLRPAFFAAEILGRTLVRAAFQRALRR